jgi:hypothetical protein
VEEKEKEHVVKKKERKERRIFMIFFCEFWKMIGECGL